MSLFLGLILGRWWRLDQICESCSQNSQHIPLHVPDRDDAIIITIVFDPKKIISAECAKKARLHVLNCGQSSLYVITLPNEIS